MVEINDLILMEIPKEQDKYIEYTYKDKDNKINLIVKEEYKNKDMLSVYPFYIDRKLIETKDKYLKIKKITFEGFNKKIPSGFITTAKGGYGFSKNLRVFINIIEKNLDIKSILISKNKKTKLFSNKKELILNHSDFEKIRKYISKSYSKAKNDSQHLITNYLNIFFPYYFEKLKKKYHKGTIHNLLLEFNNLQKELSSDDKKALSKLYEDLYISEKSFFTNKELIKAKEEIEQKYIEDIFTEFGNLLKLKKCNEERWQEFLRDNPWIFSQLFAFPTVLFKEKAYVGGKTIENIDGKIVDFLYTHNFTKNSVLVEIKNHTTKILEQKSYRGKDVFSMSKELSGAVTQVLDQKQTFMNYYKSLASETETIDYYSFNPKCIIVIGQCKDLDKKQIKSFELIRNSFKDIEVITFDELYNRIELVMNIFRREK